MKTQFRIFYRQKWHRIHETTLKKYSKYWVKIGVLSIESRSIDELLEELDYLGITYEEF